MLPGVVLHPLIDAAKHKTSVKPRYVTLVNRLPIKGVQLFYEAARLLPEVEFLAVTGGYGEQVPVPSDLKNVTVIPPQRDMRAVWSQTAVLCLPSTYDTFAMVTVEAALNGIPVLVNDVEGNGGVHEALGEHGVYVAPEAAAWVEAIRSALLPAERDRMKAFAPLWDARQELNVLEDALLPLARPNLVSALVVRNEAHRYLREVLEQCLAISDHVIVWDDASTDGSGKIAANMGCEVWRTETSIWGHDEHRVREALYQKVLKHNPRWVYVPDADEVLEHPEQVADLLSGDGSYTVDMWQCWGARDRFRFDGHWHSYMPVRLFRPPKDPKFLDMRLHCGSAPKAVVGNQANKTPSGLRMFHLGYLDFEDTKLKVERYRQLDPRAQFDSKSFYDSILEPPTLVDLSGEVVDA